MNERDLSCLSYKELQALAVKYRVPGNIKKHLLIRVLQAVKSGNESEVAKILGELHQARKKKRLKKLKRDKMSVISTPMHSPGYAMSEDCYYPQQQPPYQWVGAVEEIASRDDESTRVADYEEFERLLLRRIQRDYQSYSMKENVSGQIPSIVDLRMGAGSSTLEPILLENNRAVNSSSIVIDGKNYARVCRGEGEPRMGGEESGANNQEPVLLKKMLEAPAGANLGAIASPVKDSYRMWPPGHKYPGNNALDDSDTLTADSEIDNEDEAWETSNNINGDSGYYCPINNNNNENEKVVAASGNENNGRSRASQDNPPTQLTNNFLTDGINHYEVVYPLSNVQANCQKWIASSSFVNRDSSYMDPLAENSRGFHPIYYEETSGNSTITRPINLERKNHQQYNGTNQNVIYEANQTILEGQSTNEAHHYFPNNNGVITAPVNPLDVYYSQQMSKRVGEATQEYFGHGSSGYGNNETVVQNVYQQPSAVNQDVSSVHQFSGGSGAFNKETGSCVQSVENNSCVQYNAGYYQQYTNDNDTRHIAAFSYVDNPNQQEINQSQHLNDHHENLQQQQQQQTNVVEGEQIIGCRKSNVEPHILQPISNGALDPFWPRWPINGTLTSDGQLETLLNLHHCNYVDYTKIDQTSCVYCYTAPVVTQKVCTSESSCTQKKRLVAECRQHLFSPNRLVYSDASTGMRMANLSELSPLEIHAPPEHLSSSTEAESETIIGTTVSSDNSLNDVWIHDYSRYPVVTDNHGPRNVALMIDENEDDLFSL